MSVWTPANIHFSPLSVLCRLDAANVRNSPAPRHALTGIHFDGAQPTEKSQLGLCFSLTGWGRFVVLYGTAKNLLGQTVSCVLSQAGRNAKV
ncbi:hypothetical protein [Xenorhabdus koppenhoeferi]|uniref:Uncharacterized protein n=1 Tax=Xenorhabdus koppenhoeferi TaxID=351659 RepID=A0A1I7K3D8_9GAMM|nr:hypothetical protein [Xenorhabdus koppenhoeferi]SFU91919.1 hypothetical protein SAMN05421784_14519 [Xenorhabdus koppenhoeferi]